MDMNKSDINDTSANFSNLSVQTIKIDDNFPEWHFGVLLVFIVPLSLLILEIILGNLLVIVAVLTQPYLRTPSNMTILSMATADLAVGVFILPLNIADMLIGWRFGHILCRIWLTADVALCSTSILHICAIAVDRFRSINEGVTYAMSRNIQMSLATCGVLWIVAIWIAASPVLGWNDWNKVDPDADKITCILTRELGYIIHSASGAFFLPAVLMVILYSRIFMLIRQKLRERASLIGMDRGSKGTNVMLDDRDYSIEEEAQPQPPLSEDVTNQPPPKDSVKRTRLVEPTPGASTVGDRSPIKRKKHSEQIEVILKARLRFSLTRERKAAKTLGVIIGAFIICWAPFTLVYLIGGILLKVHRTEVIPPLLFQCVTWLGYVNSGLNPIIYTVYNPEFKRAFKTVLSSFCFNCRS